MNRDCFRGRVHRFATDRMGLLRAFSHVRSHQRMLLVTEPHSIARAQTFPFFHYARQLASRYGVEVRELPLPRYLRGDHPFGSDVHAVCFQTSFTLSPQDVRALAARLRGSFPRAKIAFFDWYAPTHLPYIEALHDQVDVYLKKHMLTDVGIYRGATRGDTNLTDYYTRRFDLSLPTRTWSIPPEAWGMVMLGWNFALSAEVLRPLPKTFPRRRRPIDLHARLAYRGDPWYQHMRQECIDHVVQLPRQISCVHDGRISREKYLRELLDSKICFSPFGYGEVCWRDFEAIAAGALLLKPDMSHMTCLPNFFIPYQTYVPIRWDLSDFSETLEHFLSDTAERERIARNAFQALRSYMDDALFLDEVRPLLTRLGLLAEVVPILSTGERRDRPQPPRVPPIPAQNQFLPRRSS